MSTEIKRKVVLTDLPPGLEIFLVDDSTEWKPSATRKFDEREVDDKKVEYVINLEAKTGAEFKTLVRCNGTHEYREARKALIEAGFEVTGWGSVSEDGWGYVLQWINFPADVMPVVNPGVYANNRWNNQHKVIFPEKVT
jgi:hypothetical protein